MALSSPHAFLRWSTALDCSRIDSTVAPSENHPVWAVVPYLAGHNNDMGIFDKFKNKSQAVKGDVKQEAGKALGNEQMQVEGKVGSAKGNLKQAGEKVKDAL
jgi:uncharacterized protein YjbJ (UPF0337 family)